MRVLILDRSDAVRTRVVEWLHDAGVHVVGHAGSLAIGRALIAEHAPDWVVSDIVLADARGMEVVTALRQCTGRPRIVILTNETYFRAACLAGGADVFLDKSRQLDHLPAALARS